MGIFLLYKLNIVRHSKQCDKYWEEGIAGCNQLKITCANENQKNRLVKSGVNEDKITVISAQSRDATPFQSFVNESSGHGSDNDKGCTIM